MIQRTGKMTRKQVEEFAGNSVRLMNYINPQQEAKFPKTAKWFRNYLNTISNNYVFWRVNNQALCSALGKPLVRMDYESNPGVWIFDGDTVSIVMYSDCYKKNAYKGTSWELVIKKSATDNDVQAAIQWLIDFLKNYQKFK